MPFAEADEYLNSILGSSPQAMRFIATFHQYRVDVEEQEAERAAEIRDDASDRSSGSYCRNMPSPER